MILKGNSRGGAKDLALHLMKEENEHVEVYELRGFASQNLMGALNEIYAVSRGTQCRQFLYSLSINPPEQARVTTEQFVDAIDRTEEKLQLSGHSRAVVFHEKEGRRHAHCVWSRIDTTNMKAVNMFQDRPRLKSVSRELFLEHGWPMPNGLADASKRDPRNFTLEQWQQAKRVGKEARAIKRAFQDAWAVSDSGAAFIHAMWERGYVMARGDRKGRIVGIDVHGEPFSVPKYADVRIKAVRQRLGDTEALPSVSEAKEQIADGMLPALERFKNELDSQAQEKNTEFEKRRKALVQRQRTERQSLREMQEARRIEANRTRQARFRKGLKGLWDRLSGEHRRISQQNEREATEAVAKDRAEKDQLAFRSLEDRRQLEIFRHDIRRQHVKDRHKLERDTRFYLQMQLDPEAKPTRKTRTRPRKRGPSPEF